VPLVHRDGAAFAAAADDLISGVFGVAEHGGHAADGPSGLGVRRRAGGRVGVQPGGDGVDAELAVHAPREDAGHDGGAGRVEGEAGFGEALGGLGRVGVGDPLGLVPVGHAADVVPGGGVLPEPFPGLLLELEPEPFGHALLDPADQDGGRADAGQVGGLVGGEQRDALIG
jgi:hypothetical protein